MATIQQNPRLQKAEIRKSRYVGNWDTDLSTACLSSPGFCCISALCPWCVSFHLRRRALRGDMSRYLCCNGDWPCSGRCGEQRSPAFCLCMEVTCCFPQSVASTRWMLQDEMRLRNTQCDNCIIGTTIAAQYLSCLCWCAALILQNDAINQAARLVDLVADVLWCSMCACMNTQHKVQLDARDKMPGMAQAPHPMVAPEQQGMSAFPPPGAYKQPPGQAAPSRGEVYPPPPPGYPTTSQ